MKKLKLIILLICFINFIKVFSNPVDSQKFQISELYFNNNNKWEIELYFEFGCDNIIDSIIFASNSETATIKGLVLEDYFLLDILVFYQDSIDKNFTLNKLGDKLEVNIFYKPPEGFPASSGMRSDQILYGDIEGSVVPAPIQSNSISLIEFVHEEGYWQSNQHCLSTNPSIGLKNEREGAIGTIQGKIYNNQNELQSYGSFWIDGLFSPDANGNYSTQVGARFHSYTDLFYELKRNSVNEFKSTDVELVDFLVMPGALIEVDFYLLDHILVTLKQKEINNSVKLLPNPTNGNLTISLQSGIADNIFSIYLTSVDGKVVAEYKGKKGTRIDLNFDQTIRSGIYFLNLEGINGFSYSERIVVNRF